MFVAEQNTSIIGIAMAYEYDELLISGRKQMRFSTLNVKPEQRRKGVGKALFNAICNWAKEHKATWLEWYASASAIPFYERLGHKGVMNSSPEQPFFEIEFEEYRSVRR